MKTHAQQHQARYRPLTRLGLGGVAIGNGFQINDDLSVCRTMQAAWDVGIRYFDTSPLYGMGMSEYRMGSLLAHHPKDEYTLSSQVGRVLCPDELFGNRKHIWKGSHRSGYRYDYSASGTRRSIEDTLQRMGVSELDMVFIADISPGNDDMKSDWEIYFKAAQQGAMPELTRMREEGIIKAWGLGVNHITPILMTLEVAEPDTFLLATQYSLIHHEDCLNRVFPACSKRGISMVIGAPLNAGFLAGKARYNYGKGYPGGVIRKLESLRNIAERHEVSLLSAALQFCAAPDVVSAIVPGAHQPEQIREIFHAVNHQEIPASFWEELRMEGLIAENAQVPADRLSMAKLA